MLRKQKHLETVKSEQGQKEPATKITDINLGQEVYTYLPNFKLGPN